MVGKKLLALLLDLTVSERRVLLNEAKKSSDKRHGALITILTAKPKDAEGFTAVLNKIGETLAGKELPESEQSLKKRRFVDFAIKEIEELKITNHLKSNPKLRNLVLSNVYDKQGTRGIMEGYLNALGTISEQQKDLDLKNYYLSKSIELKPQSQTVKSVDSWRRLLSERLELIESRYKADKAELFDLVSISYLDNGTDFKELVHAYDQSAELGEISLETEALNQVAYKIADARVNFRDEERSMKSLKLAQEALNAIDTQSNKKYELKRRIKYVAFLSAFHHGRPLTELINLIDAVLGLDRLLEKEDLKVLFYRAALGAINGEEHPTLELLRKGVSEDARYMVDFVEALLLLQEGELKKAKRLFHEVSYAGNPYVASWARVADIIINTKLGNDDLVKSLIQRANRQLDNHSNRIFSLNSSAAVLDSIAGELGYTVPVKRKGRLNDLSQITVLHQTIYSVLEQKYNRKLAS